MHPRTFAVAVNTLTLTALPAAGAALLGQASRPHAAIVAIAPAHVTTSPPGARSPLANITMDQETVQWDVGRATLYAAPDQPNLDLVPDLLYALDTRGTRYGWASDGGYSTVCPYRSETTVVHCTMSYPDALGHAPWAAVVLRVASADGHAPVTLTIRPG